MNAIRRITLRSSALHGLNAMCSDQARLEATPVQEFMGLFAA